MLYPTVLVIYTAMYVPNFLQKSIVTITIQKAKTKQRNNNIKKEQGVYISLNGVIYNGEAKIC